MSNTRKAVAKRASPATPKMTESTKEDISSYTPPRLVAGAASNGNKERIPLFYITDSDGEEKEYSVLKYIPPHVGIKYTRQARDVGAAVATVELFDVVVGKNSYEALEECEELTWPQLQEIVGFVVALTLGAVDPGKL